MNSAEELIFQMFYKDSNMTSPQLYSRFSALSSLFGCVCVVVVFKILNASHYTWLS